MAGRARAFAAAFGLDAADIVITRSFHCRRAGCRLDGGRGVIAMNEREPWHWSPGLFRLGRQAACFCTVVTRVTGTLGSITRVSFARLAGTLIRVTCGSCN